MILNLWPITELMIIIIIIRLLIHSEIMNLVNLM